MYKISIISSWMSCSLLLPLIARRFMNVKGAEQ